MHLLVMLVLVMMKKKKMKVYEEVCEREIRGGV